MLSESAAQLLYGPILVFDKIANDFDFLPPPSQFLSQLITNLRFILTCSLFGKKSDFAFLVALATQGLCLSFPIYLPLCHTCLTILTNLTCLTSLTILITPIQFENHSDYKSIPNHLDLKKIQIHSNKFQKTKKN